MGKHRKEDGVQLPNAAGDVSRRVAQQLTRPAGAGSAALAVLDRPPAVASDRRAPGVPETTGGVGSGEDRARTSNVARHASDGVAAPAVDRISGDSDTGTAVSGLSSSGVGVGGISSSGPGVSGFSTAGTGVLAVSPHGNALAVHGRAQFSRSGSAHVPKGARTETVKVAGISANSLVLVTLQSVHSGISVLGAVPEDGKFAVHLSKKAPRDTKFAWFILN